MTTAFVLSGGGSLGAVQVGMLLALDERGIAPDLIVGASVGALNGAFIAGRPGRKGVEELANIWKALRRQDVFPIAPLHGALGYYGLRNSLVRPDSLRRLVARNVSISRFDEAAIPLHIVATDSITGQEVLLSEGDAQAAVLASVAIPAIFPPVKIGNHCLIDGGVANNTPISHAIKLGADVLYVLPTGFPCTLRKPPETALGMGLHALSLLTQQRLSFDIERYENHCQLHVVPPPCPIDVNFADFTHSKELIHSAHETATEWLIMGKRRPIEGQSGVVRPHDHQIASVSEPTSAAV